MIGHVKNTLRSPTEIQMAVCMAKCQQQARRAAGYAMPEPWALLIASRRMHTA